MDTEKAASMNVGDKCDFKIGTFGVIALSVAFW